MPGKALSIMIFSEPRDVTVGRTSRSLLCKDTMLTDVVPRQRSEDLNPVVVIGRSMFKECWMRIDRVLMDYNSAYYALFKCQKSETPFTESLRGSPAHFFSLGDCISRIEHATEVWHDFKHSHFLRRVKYERHHAITGPTNRISQ